MDLPKLDPLTISEIQEKVRKSLELIAEVGFGTCRIEVKYLGSSKQSIVVWTDLPTKVRVE